MAITDITSGISYTSDSTPTVKDGIKYYTWTLTITVTGDFGMASLHCSNHGYDMGGKNKLVYDDHWQ